MLFFLVIVAVPFVLLLVAFFRPDLVEQIIREPSVGSASGQTKSVPQPD
jgi:hypothetical protein